MASAASNSFNPNNQFTTRLQGNVMVSDHGTAVLTDVGFDAAVRSVKHYASIPDHYRWVARELLLLDGTARPNVQADVWSLGCTVAQVSSHTFVLCNDGLSLQQMMTLKEPFPHLKTLHKFLLALRDGPLFVALHPTIPQRLWNLLGECWRDIPSARPTADVIHRRFEAMSDLF